MSLAPLVERFLQHLANVLGPYGLVRRKQAFVLDHGDAAWIVHIAVIPHDADFDITVDFAVRHHAIQDRLRAKWYGTISKRTFRDTATAGCEVGNYSQGRQHRWTITSEGDIPVVVADIDHWFQGHIRLWLEELSTLHGLQKALTEGEERARLLCPLPGQCDDVLNAIAEMEKSAG